MCIFGPRLPPPKTRLVIIFSRPSITQVFQPRVDNYNLRGSFIDRISYLLVYSLASGSVPLMSNYILAIRLLRIVQPFLLLPLKCNLFKRKWTIIHMNVINAVVVEGDTVIRWHIFL